MQGGAKIVHLDDRPWFDVARFRLRDGRQVAIREKWIEISPRYVCFYNEWDPGAMTPPHGHHGDHSILILRGDISNGSVVCGEGTHILLEYGDTFGPWTAGSEGCLLYGVIMGHGAPFFDQPAWQAFLAREGAVELPVPPPPLPIWAAGSTVLPGPVHDES